MAALAAEFRALLHLGATIGAFEQTERLSAVVAELALSGRLAAMRAYRSAFLQLTMPHRGCLRFLVNVATHGLVSGLCHISALSRSTIDAKSFFLVPAVGANPTVAGGTFGEMRLHFFLGFVKGFLLLFAPLGTSVFHAFAQKIGTGFNGVAETAQFAAQQVAKEARTPAKSLCPLPAIICR